MTCIVGLMENDEVWIAADGQTSFGDTVVPVVLPKIIRFSEPNMLVAVAGKPRVLQLIGATFKMPPRRDDQDLFDWICVDFIDALRTLLDDKGVAMIAQKDDCETHLLIACEGRLFYMDSAYAVHEPRRGYDASGSGCDYALGYLYASGADAPEDRVLGAVEAACEFSASCGAPICVEKL